MTSRELVQHSRRSRDELTRSVSGAVLTFAPKGQLWGVETLGLTMVWVPPGFFAH